MRRLLATVTAVLAAALASAGTAGATTFYLSTMGGPVVPSLPGSRGGDIVQYDDSSPGTASVFFNEDIFTDIGNPLGPEVDAFEILPDGRMLFSTSGGAVDLGTNSVNVVDGDVVEYDPVSGLAVLVFQEQPNFQGQANIDAIAVLPNGHLLFSTEDDQTLTIPGPDVGILDGDIIEWDPLTDTFVGIFVSEATLFGGADADIDAFDLTAEGNWALSTDAAASIGLLNFSGSDLVLYDINTDTAIIWLPESIFSNPGGSPLDAIAVPEPGTATLFALGLLGLALAGRRRPS